MSWIDETINSPESVVTEFVKEHLPQAHQLMIIWADADGNVTYRASEMQVCTALGMMEMIKSMLFEYLAEEDDNE